MKPTCGYEGCGKEESHVWHQVSPRLKVNIYNHTFQLVAQELPSACDRCSGRGLITHQCRECEMGLNSCSCSPESCPDCDRAARYAYSDATTPGFFSPFCSKHKPAAQAGEPLCVYELPGGKLCGHKLLDDIHRGEAAVWTGNAHKFQAETILKPSQIFKPDEARQVGIQVPDDVVEVHVFGGTFKPSAPVQGAGDPCTCKMPDFQHAICPVHAIEAAEMQGRYSGVQGAAPGPLDLRKIALERADGIEKQYGHCCGDMLNISAADLADEIQEVLLFVQEKLATPEPSAGETCKPTLSSCGSPNECLKSNRCLRKLPTGVSEGLLKLCRHCQSVHAIGTACPTGGTIHSATPQPTAAELITTRLQEIAERPQNLFKREWSDDFSEDMWNGHQMCLFAETYAAGLLKLVEELREEVQLHQTPQ